MHPFVLPLPDDSRALVFGLAWRTILGENLDAVASRLARQQRATHYTRAGQRSTVAGLLTLNNANTTGARRAILHSAAAAFARACPRGAAALCLQLPCGTWVAAAQDGVVLVGSDVIHPSAQAAQAHLERLLSEHPGLVIHGDRPGDQPMALQALHARLDAATLLRRTARGYLRRPGRAAVLLAAATCVAAGHWAYNAHVHTRARHSQQHLTAAAQPQDAHTLWRVALQDWAAHTRVHDHDTLRQALTMLEAVPAHARRWSLQEVDCHLAAGTCTADYLREPLGTSTALRAALPADWSIEWPALHRAVARWQLPAAMRGRPLEPDHLISPESLAFAWVPQLQRLTPALTDIALAPAVPVAITAPVLEQPDGRRVAVPYPATAAHALPARRDLVVNGPLRSLYLLPLPEGASLQRLHVRRTPVSTAGLNASTLAATLTGTIHVR